jgi:uncharacterized protein YlxW (UPF0749 family)
MQDWPVLLKRVQDKLQQLLREKTGLEKENRQLRASLEAMEKTRLEQEAALETLRMQVDVLRLNGAGLDPADKKEFEKKISQYIREIDRCIALLAE